MANIIRGMDLSLGACVRLDNKICKVLEKQHVKPGKGGAYLQVVLKTLDGIKIDHRFSSSDYVTLVMMERKKFQFSYLEKSAVVLTDLETYETLELTAYHIPERSLYLIQKFANDDTVIEVEYADDVVYNAVMPPNVTVVVDSADPIVKGQTAASSYKNAVICNDITIGVPPYISAGDKIIVNLYGEKGIEFLSRE